MMFRKITILAIICSLFLCGCGASDRQWKEAYRNTVEAFYEENKEYDPDNTLVCFDLVYFDDDDIPELVADFSGQYVNLYTFRDGGIMPIFENRGYGAFGNVGYCYYPRESTIFNSNSDYAGGVDYTNYAKWNPQLGDFESVYDEQLFSSMFADQNGNGYIDPEEAEGEMLEERVYYFGSRQISEEEYDAYYPKGDYACLNGVMTYEEIMEQLK